MRLHGVQGQWLFNNWDRKLAIYHLPWLGTRYRISALGGPGRRVQQQPTSGLAGLQVRHTT